MSRVLTDIDVEAIADALAERHAAAACECPLNDADIAALPEAIRFYRNWNSIFTGASSIVGRTLLTAVTLLIVGVFGLGVIGWVAQKIEQYNLIR